MRLDMISVLCRLLLSVNVQKSGDCGKIFPEVSFRMCFRFQGYPANIVTIDHVTPLHEACLSGHVACVRALVKAGANVSVTLTQYHGSVLISHLLNTINSTQNQTQKS